MADKTIDIFIEAHNRASKEINRVQNSLNSLTDNLKDMEKVQAGLIGMGVGIGASFASAGVGVAGFGAVAISTLNDVFKASSELAEAQEALNNADTAKEKAEALQMKAEAMEGLSDQQQKALGSLQKFQSFWGKFAKQFEKPVVQTFIKGLKALETILKGLKPAISGVASAIVSMMDSLNKKLKTQEFQKFFSWLGQRAEPAMKALGKVVGNVFMSIINLLQAFSPVSKSVQTGLVGLTQDFEDWTSSLKQSKSFQKFINFVQKNTPKVIGIIKNMIKIGAKIAEKLSPVISGLLTVFKKLTNHTEAVAIAFIAFKASAMALSLISGIVSIVTTCITVFKALRSSTMLATAATWLFNTALWANPITWIIAGIVALIAVIVLLWKNWKQVSTFLVQSWKNIKTAGMALWYLFTQWLKNLWNKVTTWLSNKWNQIKTNAIDLFHKAVEGIKNKFEQVMDIVDTVKKVFKRVKSAIGNGMDKAWDKLKDWANNFYNGGKSLIEAVARGIRDAVGSITDAVSWVAEKARGFFGNSDAKYGPFSDITQSGYDTMSAFAKGARSAERLVNSSIGKTLSGANGGLEMGLSLSGRGAENSLRSKQPASQSIGSINITVNNGNGELDEKKISEYVMQDIYDNLNG